MSKQPKYRFYATLLDAFWNYLNSDVIYNRYWGFSENPPHTEEEFREIQFKDFIDRINRVPFDSEPADMGTAFNEVIDCMVESRKSESVEVEKVYIDENGRECDENVVGSIIVSLRTTYNNRTFTFPITICREFANYFKGALTQQRVEAILPTSFGDVLVYGNIDELMPTAVHDIKYTGKYSAFKFKDHFQHLVYPYCLIQNGNDIRTFEYNITDMKETFTEVYVFVPERDIPILTSHCEELIRCIEENRDLISDKKIFGK